MSQEDTEGTSTMALVAQSIMKVVVSYSGLNWLNMTYVLQSWSSVARVSDLSNAVSGETGRLHKLKTSTRYSFH